MADDNTSDRWRVTWPGASLDGFKDSDAFVALLRLSRVVNAFRFIHISVADYGGVPDSPSHSRQRIQAFLLSCGLLHEAFLVADACGKHLRHVPSWKERMVPLLRSADVRRLRAADLSLIRNKIAFHFDDDAMREGLGDFKGTELDFLKSWGRAGGDIHFSLADVLAVNYVLDQQPDGDDPLDDDDRVERFKQLLSEVTKFQLAFCDAAEVVIAQSLRDLGWKRSVLGRESS